MKWDIDDESLAYDRAYAFGYNNLNRLTEANYCGKNGTSTYSSVTGKYNTSYSYDKMGNIQTLTRKENGSNLNNLTYTYNGNQLKKVDNSWSPTILYGSEAFNDRVKIATEYIYDKNGNTTYDGNAGISTFDHNLLNLPEVVQFKDGHQNRYSYSADGRKLRSDIYTLNSVINVPQGTINPVPGNPADYNKVTTDYIENLVYQDGSLKQVQTPEGYWQNGVYYYYLKDHLGNIRVVLNSSGSVVEKNHYYPFGMRFYPESTSTSNSAALPFRYNGKEFESMNGLNRYDYEARFYDPELGRFHSVDPMAEKYYFQSPYTYAVNNPIKYIDKNGEGPEELNKGVDPSPLGVLFEAFQNARAGLFNMEMRVLGLAGVEKAKGVRMRVNYSSDGTIPVDNPVTVGGESKKSVLKETGDIVLDALSLTPLAELSSTKAMAAPFLAARTPSSIIPSVAKQFKICNAWNAQMPL